MDLDAVIREEIGRFPAASIRYAGRPIEVCADGLLSMVVTNLIGNACKFGGPEVEIAVTFEEDAGEVLVAVLNPLNRDLQAEVSARIGKPCHFYLAHPQIWQHVFSKIAPPAA